MTANVIAVAEAATLMEALRKLVASKVSALVALDSDGTPITLRAAGAFPAPIAMTSARRPCAAFFAVS